MNALLSNPTFIFALVAFIASITAYINSITERGRTNDNTKLVAKHEEQLNGVFASRVRDIMATEAHNQATRKDLQSPQSIADVPTVK